MKGLQLMFFMVLINIYLTLVKYSYLKIAIKKPLKTHTKKNKKLLT